MRRITVRASLLALAMIAITLFVSWSIRLWVEQHLSYGEPLPVLGEVLRLTYTRNAGLAFGFLQGNDLVPYLSGTALFFITIYLGRPLSSSRVGPLLLGLIIGGSVANLIDRLNDGHVTDYVDFGIGSWRYATFNFPDACIVVGLTLCAWMLPRLKKNSLMVFSVLR